MTGTQNGPVRIYLAIGLAILLVVVLYFRLFHKKSTRLAASVPSGVHVAELIVPQIQIPASQGGQQPQLEANAAACPIKRDIFRPVKLVAPERQAPQSVQESFEPALSLKLKGTILGSNKPVAIINDQFVRQGDHIGGYRVIGISKDKVVLRSSRHPWTERVLKLIEKGTHLYGN